MHLLSADYYYYWLLHDTHELNDMDKKALGKGIGDIVAQNLRR